MSDLPNGFVVVEGINRAQFEYSGLNEKIVKWLKANRDTQTQMKVIIDGHIVQFQPIPIDLSNTTIITSGAELNRVFNR